MLATIRLPMLSPASTGGENERIGGKREGELTWPGNQLDSIHSQDKREESIEMDIKTVGPLHMCRLGTRFLQHISSQSPVREI